MTSPDMGLDTVVAGIRCRDVLDALSEFLDDEIVPDQRTAIVAHLSACDRCARFGDDIALMLNAMRTALEAQLDRDVVGADQARASRVRSAVRRVQAM